ncbi:MAG: 16S rRNA (cytidine(1402)-2'-O)-methyltransferase [Flavobacteriales bacterium]|nr:16S rRNA (cytidine(1402)-2'-O)-methyltransferase [Flavobacteriales bacterium]NCG30519.1 16S rRNA (cytidine(1402)-2'-O)-methyltransferase [Bacteroidota bacterium]MBT3963340.1 16S rRNA (cytidine(1402)-2'-O)-methyltransferase [Flavobacteriales bacterium]MBT4705551.1 16S rRNA (cytidine(1402)-2'-O)-methyltransferase [Flavobacteriales bacterium]MBT4931090.1 16S rRNA (cytidine(1402)-2'-O)-methyltransferase [Flavobacteriales bacterium]
MSGKLIIIPTPIGNLDDITLRALEILKTADAILCEDTRHSSKLLKHHGIENKLMPFHQHNEHKALESTLNRINTGDVLALISDAGTPGISDPGFMLVRGAIAADLEVEVLPGPTAHITALVGSGLPSEKYVYLGFPPQKKGRQTFWKSLSEQDFTMVIYESPHRILKALNEAKEVLGIERLGCVARELSKIHETYHRGKLHELAEACEQTPFKGEIVLILEGKAHFEKRQKA